MADKKPFSRLPKNVQPSNYTLKLKPDLEKLTFEGWEDIAVKTVQSTSKIILNSVDIKVGSVAYTGAGQAFSKDIKISYSEADETLTLDFPEALKVGDGKLSFTYTGNLNDKMKGFYRSKYFGPNGEEKYAAVTQFESTYARYAFPCWDEPAIKATFDVTLVAPSNRVALSNMPVISEKQLDGGLKELVYDKTPIMSTYLLAFVVGEYDYVESKDSNGVVVRVYTPLGKKEQGRFALEVAVKTLPFYNKYFNIAYPLPKMDLIAISDFSAGAMENWGLVTYREARLLIDPEHSSALTKQDVTLVVGHEIAHQWFGNLVTMEWWTHLWLNEGFASWIEYLCVDHCFPEYDIWTQFATSDLTRALDLDALHNSHPIEVEVGHPSEVDEIFDAISYSKGASVIRMLHDYIGDADFRKGMHAYLTKHAYKNTFTEDLWASLGEASGKPIDKIMSTWTKQLGFPLIKVEWGPAGDGEGGRTLTVSQQKFTADGKTNPNDKSHWLVPITIVTSDSPGKASIKTVLEDKQTTLRLDKACDWVKVNCGGVGFYRTSYPEDMLKSLLPAVKDKSLPPRDRLSLENDLFALCRAGACSAVEVLTLVEAYKDETNFTVWSDVSSNLSTLAILYQNTDFYDNFSSYVRQLFKPAMTRLGWDHKDGEGHLETLLRSLVIGRLGRAGEVSVIEEAKKRFALHSAGTKQIPADLRQAVYSIVLKYGGEKEFEEMLKLYRSADLQEEKVRILRALGSVSTPALIQRTLDFSLSKEVRSMDTVFVIASVGVSLLGREEAWKFLQKQWPELHNRYESGFLLSRLIQSTTENFCTLEKAAEVEAFFASNKVAGAERTIQQSLENIRLNVEQLNRDKDRVKEFLKAYN